MTGTIAPGSNGAGLVRRIYRRSPIKYLHRVAWPYRGVRPNDVFTASYPRSGSLWLRFLLTELLAGSASFASGRRHVPPVGLHRDSPEIVPGGGRLIKAHEQYIPRYHRRAIHMVRDARDVAISYFDYLQRLEHIVVRPTDDAAASFDRYIDAFLAGRMDSYGTWQDHLLSWERAVRDGRDILRVRYEDLSSDGETELVRIADWLGKPTTRDEAAQILERCSFERMQKAEDEASGETYFTKKMLATGRRVVREGRAGGWRTSLTAEQQARFASFNQGLELAGYPLAG